MYGNGFGATNPKAVNGQVQIGRGSFGGNTGDYDRRRKCGGCIRGVDCDWVVPI